MADMLPSCGKMIGSQASETTMKSSWHQASRKYECRWKRMPYAIIFITSSKVKMYRYTHSSRARTNSFHVPGGSRGEAHAIVTQLHMIVSRISGSKSGASMISIAVRRRQWYGSRQPNEREW